MTASQRVGVWLGVVRAWIGFVAAMAIYQPAAGQRGPDAPDGWAGRYPVIAYADWIDWIALLYRQGVVSA